MKTKKYLQAFTGIILFLSGLPGLKAQTVTDIDGNVYNTVTIGTQVWMAENLKTTHYNYGYPISNITDNTEWANVKSGAYCWYNNKAEYKDVYGALYNWYTVMGTLCPTGWHVPTAKDWIKLITYLGDSIAGGKLKEKGTAHWYSPNTGATNETGFTALAAGGRHENGSFYDLGSQIIMWSTTITSLPCPGGKGCKSSQNARYIRNDLISLDHLFVNDQNSGFSVRCVCNNITSPLGIDDVNSESVVFYPNPASDKLYFKNNNDPNTIIMVYDLQGIKILERKVDSEFIDISNLRKGIYIAKVIFPEKIMTAKFIKE